MKVTIIQALTEEYPGYMVPPRYLLDLLGRDHDYVVNLLGKMSINGANVDNGSLYSVHCAKCRSIFMCADDAFIEHALRSQNHIIKKIASIGANEWFTVTGREIRRGMDSCDAASMNEALG